MDMKIERKRRVEVCKTFFLRRKWFLFGKKVHVKFYIYLDIISKNSNLTYNLKTNCIEIVPVKGRREKWITKKEVE